MHGVYIHAVRLLRGHHPNNLAVRQSVADILHHHRLRAGVCHESSSAGLDTADALQEACEVLDIIIAVRRLDGDRSDGRVVCTAGKRKPIVGHAAVVVPAVDEEYGGCVGVGVVKLEVDFSATAVEVSFMRSVFVRDCCRGTVGVVSQPLETRFGSSGLTRRR